MAAVQAAGAEQVRQTAETSNNTGMSQSSQVLAGATGHRPPGTADVAAQLVAEGNAEYTARVVRELGQARAQVAELQQACADVTDDDLASDNESTATAADTEGATKRQRKRKKLGKLAKAISSIGKGGAMLA